MGKDSQNVRIAAVHIADCTAERCETYNTLLLFFPHFLDVYLINWKTV